MKKPELNKPFPSFNTDEEAEDFVANADLSEYDFSTLKRVHFEFAPKNASINIRLPDSLLFTVRQKAKEAGLPYQKYIRMTLENAVNKI
jgi:predicted DNA binding CopG/RHH family protein